MANSSKNENDSLANPLNISNIISISNIFNVLKIACNLKPNDDPETLKTTLEKRFLTTRHIVCIDGPSASGKGTLAKKLADTLSFEYLDSGLLYRAIAYAALLYTKKHAKKLNNINEDNLSGANFDALYHKKPEILHEILEYFSQENIALKNMQMIHQGQIITPQLRNEKIGLLASTLAKYPAVRQALLNKQREIAQQHSLVADGRDMGSVVFSDAPFKFFLTASLQERAWRRFCELYPDMNLMEDAMKSPEYQKVFNSIHNRDFQDQNRDSAPLVAANDAILIDSEDLTADEVFEKVLTEIVRKVLA